MSADGEGVIKELSTGELARRQRLLGFDDADAAVLARAAPLVAAEKAVVCYRFYRQLLRDPDARRVIHGEMRTRHAAALARYIDELFAGHYDESYIASRQRMGLAHQREGVEPALYLSANRILREELARVLRQSVVEGAERDAVMGALDKLLLLDTSIVLDTYHRALVNEVAAARDRAQRYASVLETKTRELEELAHRDPLTGLLNRRSFLDALRRDLSLVARGAQPLAVVFIDLDDFKATNDTRGHAAGDEVLRGIGELLRALLRAGDSACRWGGDEFALSLPATDMAGARTMCERLRTLLAARLPGTALSVGVACLEGGARLGAEAMVAAADRFMYHAKAEHGFSVASGFVQDADPPAPPSPRAREDAGPLPGPPHTQQGRAATR